MKKALKSINRFIASGNYKEAYDGLKKVQYKYTLENFSKDFFGVDSLNKYNFLLYVLAKNPTVNLVLLICDTLMYLEPPFYDIYPVIRWHILNTVKLFSDFETIVLKLWTIDSFYEHPSSPFSDKEIYTFANEIHDYYPDYEKIISILNNVNF